MARNFRKPRSSKEFLKRSRAAKKGARTREKNKREAFEKRSRAARKGAKTRKRNRAAREREVREKRETQLTSVTPEGRRAELLRNELYADHAVPIDRIRVVYIPHDAGYLRYFQIDKFDSFMAQDLYDDFRIRMLEEGTFTLSIVRDNGVLPIPISPSKPRKPTRHDKSRMSPGTVEEIAP